MNAGSSCSEPIDAGSICPVTVTVETAMSIPITSAPPSPMKIFAGCQLKGRNPRVAPSRTAITMEARLNAD